MLDCGRGGAKGGRGGGGGERRTGNKEQSHLQHKDGTHVTLIRWSMICQGMRSIERSQSREFRHMAKGGGGQRHLIKKANEPGGGERPALARDAQKLKRSV
jgi:hypothetical protein